jgi:hypothetical protein
MIKENDIVNIIYGVLFNNSFKLLDSWGQIADDILYNNKYFDYNYFPNISEQYTTERILHNPKTGDFIKLSSSGLVFKYKTNSDFNKDYKEFGKKINEYLIPSILVEYDSIFN